MKPFKPPRLAQRFLRWYCHPDLVQEIEGDLLELYGRRRKKMSILKANALYWFNIIAFCQPWAWKKTRINHLIFQNAMYKNFLISSFRFFKKEKFYTSVNLLGFVLGIGGFLIISQYLLFELSYEDFIFDKEKIFRIDQSSVRNGEAYENTGGPVPLGPTIESEIPEIDQVVRLWRSANASIMVEKDGFKVPTLFFADANTSEFFELDFFHGNRTSSLTTPNSVIISKSQANRLFGTTEALGKIIKYNGYPAGELLLTVTGVFNDLPKNTHLNFDFLVSLEGVETEADNWGSFKPVFTYVKLFNAEQALNVENKFKDIALKYIPDRVKESDKFQFHLINIADIHLEAKTVWNMKPGNDKFLLSVLGIVGVLILILAVFNYINLATATATYRVKEVIIRKIMGASKGLMQWQFLLESFYLAIIASGITIISLIFSQQALEQFFHQSLILDFSKLSLWYTLGIITLIISLLSGIYPSLIITNFSTNQLSKRRTGDKRNLNSFGRLLVVFQFIVSISLIAFTFMVNDQVEYMLKKDVGFDKNQLLVIPHTGKENGDETIEKLRQFSFVDQLSVSQSVPVYGAGYDGRTIRMRSNEEKYSVRSLIANPDYLPTYGLALLSGRNFYKSDKDTAGLILNEKAVTALGLGNAEEAIGRKLVWSSYFEGPVIGVVKDYHINSLHDEIEPLVIINKPHWNFWKAFITLKINGQPTINQITDIEKVWKSTAGEGHIWEYFFLNEKFQKAHQQDILFESTIRVLSILSILLACMGLIGISAFNIKLKVKEVGVRKVFGAKIYQLLGLLSATLTTNIIIGFLVAMPLVWFARDTWISSFPYKVTFNWLNIFGAGALTFLLALLAASYYTLRLAFANPIDTLRDE